MAVTITRTPWVDDDGTGTTGTIINNAVKTSLYNEIDVALAGLLPLSGGVITGALSIATTLTVGGLLSGANATFSGLITVQNWIKIGTAPGMIRVSDGSGNGTLIAYDVTYRGLNLDGSSITLFASGVPKVILAPAGNLLIGAGAPAAGFLSVIADPNLNFCLTCSVTTNLAGGNFVGFLNASLVPQGTITSPNSTTVAYNTSSDARLKKDLGVALAPSVLGAVQVHDFEWRQTGIRARGVFAQETFAVAPFAINRGRTEDLGPDGYPIDPWMADYSKFVPDLIVGWQDHDRRLTALEAR